MNSDIATSKFGRAGVAADVVSSAAGRIGQEANVVSTASFLKRCKRGRPRGCRRTRGAGARGLMRGNGQIAAPV